MVVSKERIRHILEEYDKDDLVIATACSHTSLQIFDGARKEGFKTMGIAVGQKTKQTGAAPWKTSDVATGDSRLEPADNSPADAPP